MKNVVIITNIPSPYRVDLFYYMQTHIKEYEIHVIYTNKTEDNRQWSVRQEKILNSQILESRIIKLKNDLDSRYVHLPLNIGKVLSQIRPNAVIAFEYNPAAMQALAWCKLHQIKFIHLTDGTLHSERNISKLQLLCRKIITSQASACIASSTKAKEKLLHYGVPEERIFISLLTENLEPYKSIMRQPVKGRLLYVGSMIKRKGLDLLFDALSYMRSDWELHVVGNGTDEEQRELKAQAERNGIANRICWCGYKEGDQLYQEYQEAAVFVLPTREDCYGLVLLEAYCAKVPIVSSKYADGAYDIINDGNGLLVDPYDFRNTAAALDMVLSDNNFFQKALENKADTFEFSATTKGYIEALQSVL